MRQEICRQPQARWSRSHPKTFLPKTFLPKTFLKDTRAQAIFGKAVGCGEGSVEVLFQDITHTKTRRCFVGHSEKNGFEEVGPSLNVHPGCTVQDNPGQLFLIFSSLQAFL